MDIKKEIDFWKRELKLPQKLFYKHKPWIKSSNIADLSYKNGFGHGTCHIRVYGRDLYEYVMMSLKYLRESSSFKRISRP